MRIVKSIPDIQKVLNELLDWKAAMETKDISLGGRRIRNAATSEQANDYVTRKELPPPFPDIPIIQPQGSTVVFDRQETVVTDEVIPEFVFGIGREAQPVEVWMYAVNAPTSDDLIVNIKLYQRNPLGTDLDPFTILEEDLKILKNATDNDLFVSSRTLITPPPRFGTYSRIQPKIISGGDASCVTIGVVCKRIL